MSKIKIASWNVNSVNARLENLLFWLQETKPDIALLQEIKCVDEDFPYLPIEELGYQIAAFGQKSYNGVAILSKFPIDDIIKNLDKNDPQSRYIEGVITIEDKAIRVASIYVPNGGANLSEGQKVNETDRFAYKMQFFDNLHNHLKNLLRHNEIAIFGGDYNVAINNIDVYDPKNLQNHLCFHIDEKQKMRQILNLGYIDSFRAINQNSQNFSWWDYRGNCWSYNKGFRIDYLLTSPCASDILSSAYMDDKLMMERKKPSDHCPVVCILNL